MSQTSIIAASLVIAFIVFITLRGELPAYLAVFGAGPVTVPVKAGGGSGVTPATAQDNFFNDPLGTVAAH